MAGGNIAELVADRSILICCGPGGVGKTTVAAALAVEGARRGRRTVVVTIDPAKRLADALGLDDLTNTPRRIEGDWPGELWALMLDPRSTFDGLVTRHAPEPGQAETILANRFYRNIAGALSGTQEYMAAETLHALHGDERFDQVIVDTPPSRNALDFLEAPGVLTRFLDHKLFKVMMLPARRGMGVFNLAAQPVLRATGKVVGSDVLADAVAFFQAFAGMESGFRERADDVLALLRSDVTRFVLVASPRHDTIDEAMWFAGQLARQDLSVSAAIVNRVHPTFGTWSAQQARKRAGEASGPAAALWRNAAELADIVAAERGVAEPLVKAIEGAALAEVPLLRGDVHDLDGLAQIGAALFDRQ